MERYSSAACAMVMVVLGGCQPPAQQQTAQALPPSFSLKCVGPEQVEMEREGVKQPAVPGAPAEVFYRWNDETKTLVTEHPGTEATAFCHDDGQEECSIAVADGRLVGKSFDLRRGNAPDAVNSFSEKVDIDLAALSGTATMTTSVGTLTDEAAKVHQKTTVRMTLSCVPS